MCGVWLSYMTLSTWSALAPQQSRGSTLQPINHWQTSTVSTSSRCWVGNGTSPPASECHICMSLTWSVSGECRRILQTAMTWYSTGCRSPLLTHAHHTHCQWHQLACWWHHLTPINWYSSTQTAMNWDALNYRKTWYHSTPWSRQLVHISSVFTTHNWSSIRSLKSTLEVKCCVSSAVHV